VSDEQSIGDVSQDQATMRFLTEDEYGRQVDGLHKNWENFRERWHYHQAAIDWLRDLKPESVLEVGSLGIRLTDRSDTMDLNERWRIAAPDIDFIHDMRDIPWPVGHYDVVVGLRSFHYCGDKLQSVFAEASRVGDSVILALPRDFDVSTLPVPRKTVEGLPTRTNLYLWRSE